MFFPVPPRRDPVPTPETKLPPPPPDTTAYIPPPEFHLPPSIKTPIKAPPQPTDTGPVSSFRGSFRLFRLAGTDVFIHWSWFVVAYFMLKDPPVKYSSMAWDIAEYVAGFGIVLLHEFGHVLACRWVGGAADRILLWPLGGLAFVAPPPRPSASLITTVAGPLVNVVLAPILIGLVFLVAPAIEDGAAPDLRLFLGAIAWFNVVVLVFNLLPIFPLDGGRILQAILWPLLGRSLSLSVAAVIGIVSGIGLGILAISIREFPLGLLALFLVLGAIGGLSQARQLARVGQALRRTDRTCPNCKSAPPFGAYWRCPRCLTAFDPFHPSEVCPKCGTHATDVPCPECGRQAALADWSSPASIEIVPPDPAQY